MSVFRNFTSGVSFLIKFQVQVFAFDFGEIFKNTFFTEHIWTIAYIANNSEHFDTQVRNTVTYTYHLSRKCHLSMYLFWITFVPIITKKNMEIEFWELIKSFHISFVAFYKYLTYSTVSFIYTKIFSVEHNSQNNSDNSQNFVKLSNIIFVVCCVEVVVQRGS